MSSIDESARQYYLRMIEKQFDEIKEDLKEIKRTIVALQEFKIQNIATARTVSFVVSAVSGAMTLLASVALAWYSRK